MKGSTVANRLTESTEESCDYVEQILSGNVVINANGSDGDISWVLENNAPNVGMNTIHVTIAKQGWGAKPITISYVTVN